MGITDGHSELGTADEGTSDGEAVGFTELGDKEGSAVGKLDGSIVSVGFVGRCELGIALGLLELGTSVGTADVGL